MCGTELLKQLRPSREVYLAYALTCVLNSLRVVSDEMLESCEISDLTDAAETYWLLELQSNFR